MAYGGEAATADAPAELDERLRFVLGKIPVSVIDGVRPQPEVTPLAQVPTPAPTPVNGNGNGTPHGNSAANGSGRVVSGTITSAGEG